MVTDLNKNWRIEFFGGPNDGEVLYWKEPPLGVHSIGAKEEYDGQLKTVVHQYELSERNGYSLKYRFVGTIIPQ